MTDTVAKILIAFGLTAFGCSSSPESDPDTGTIPRRYEYPRLPLPADTAMVICRDTPVPVSVNAATRVTYTPGDSATPPGLTVDYPDAMGATLYFTFIPVTSDNVADVLERRRERISLNLSGRHATTLHSDTGDGILVTAMSVANTPVQMLGLLDDRWVVTATGVVHNPVPVNAYDSVLPLYNLLRRDMAQALSDLKFQLPSHD